MKLGAVFFCLLLWFGATPAGDADAAQLDRLLAENHSPGGVVFEIITWEDHSWDWAAPRLQDYVGRLRARFPRLEFALVSHGAELFELTREAGHSRRASIELLARLSAAGMAVHVDGDYASWKRLGPQDFLDFVDVIPSAQAQLADYASLGFTRIRLEPPDGTDR